MRRARVDGHDQSVVGVADRGLRFGDGLFETLLATGREPVWWDGHMARLQRGCERLGMSFPPPSQMQEEARSMLDETGDGVSVLRIQLSRGGGTRGYASDPESGTHRIISAEPASGLHAADYREGVAVRWCSFTLARQPRLAGIKHLNRLEQVMARREWNDPQIGEGLMCDGEGRVIGATAANLFVVRDGRLATPSLQHCGIEGTCRAWIMRQVQVQVCDLDREQVMAADELFLSSSLRGILPVRQLDGRKWSVGAMTRDLQHTLWREVPALRPFPDRAA